MYVIHIKKGKEKIDLFYKVKEQAEFVYRMLLDNLPTVRTDFSSTADRVEGNVEFKEIINKASIKLEEVKENNDHGKTLEHIGRNTQTPKNKTLKTQHRASKKQKTAKKSVKTKKGSK